MTPPVFFDANSRRQYVNSELMKESHKMSLSPKSHREKSVSYSNILIAVSFAMVKY